MQKDDEVDELLKNYDGNILRIVSDKDELNERVKHHNYVLAGDELILKWQRPCDGWFYVSR